MTQRQHTHTSPIVWQQSARLVCLLLLLLRLQPLQAQLYLNGDFENLQANGQLRFWWPSAGSNCSWRIDSVTRYSGQQSLYCHCPDSLRSGSFLVFSMQVAIRNMQLPATVKVISRVRVIKEQQPGFYTFLNGKRFGPPPNRRDTAYRTPPTADQPGWTTVTNEYQLTDTSLTLGFGFVVNKGCELYIDAIEMQVNGKPVQDLGTAFRPLLPDEARARTALVRTATRIKKMEVPSSYTFLRRAVGNSRIVALGESTHGTHEFHTARTAMIKYLVTKMNFNIIVFEDEYFEVEQANALLANDTIPVRKVMEQTFKRIHMVQEVEDLLTWVRDYNRKARNKIVLAGMDMQHYYLAYRRFGNRLPAGDNPMRALYDSLAHILRTRNFSAGKFDTLSRMSAMLQQAYLAACNQDADSMCAGGMELEIMKNAFRKTSLAPYQGGWFRDSVMAAYVQQTARNHPGSKMVLWAHYAHLSRQSDKDSSITLIGMGAHLARIYGPQYRSYILLAGNGDATGYDRNGQPYTYKCWPPDIECYEYYFDKPGWQAAFIPVPRAAQRVPHLYDQLKARNIGFGGSYTPSQFSAINLAAGFDGIFFFRNSTKALSFYYK